MADREYIMLIVVLIVALIVLGASIIIQDSHTIDPDLFASYLNKYKVQDQKRIMKLIRLYEAGLNPNEFLINSQATEVEITTE